MRLRSHFSLSRSRIRTSRTSLELIPLSYVHGVDDRDILKSSGMSDTIVVSSVIEARGYGGALMVSLMSLGASDYSSA
jgi:hypothetical protein